MTKRRESKREAQKRNRAIFEEFSEPTSPAGILTGSEPIAEPPKPRKKAKTRKQAKKTPKKKWKIKKKGKK